jgi:hypothetical protein
MHAVDFVVLKDGETIAGTDTQTIQSNWEATGWKDKLLEAVTKSASWFDGPLSQPYEPWHYTLKAAKQNKRSA